MKNNLVDGISRYWHLMITFVALVGLAYLYQYRVDQLEHNYERLEGRVTVQEDNASAFEKETIERLATIEQLTRDMREDLNFLVRNSSNVQSRVQVEVEPEVTVVRVPETNNSKETNTTRETIIIEKSAPPSNENGLNDYIQFVNNGGGGTYLEFLLSLNSN